MKVFCIGFHRTGTRSLHAFLGRSGLRSIHWPHQIDGVCYEALTIPHLANREEVVRLLAPVIDRYDAFSDVPFPALYRELCETYPGSRFVLVTRDLDRWWKSLVQHWKLDERVFRALDPYEFMQYNLHAEAPLHYVTIRDKARLIELHREHVAAVLDCFSKRPSSLLSVDLDDVDIAGKLSRFLGVPCRSPFPRAT